MAKVYWAVYKGKTVLHEGTFSECWTYFVTNFGDDILSSLDERGIRVGRYK